MSELQLLTKFDADNEWLQANFDAVQEKFEERFVAVGDKRVIAADKNLEKVIELVKAKGLDPAFVLVEYIPKKGVTIIL